jgi:hypothetical protein
MDVIPVDECAACHAHLDSPALEFCAEEKAGGVIYDAEWSICNVNCGFVLAEMIGAHQSAEYTALVLARYYFLEHLQANTVNVHKNVHS